MSTSAATASLEANREREGRSESFEGPRCMSLVNRMLPKLNTSSAIGRVASLVSHNGQYKPAWDSRKLLWESN